MSLVLEMHGMRRVELTQISRREVGKVATKRRPQGALIQYLPLNGCHDDVLEICLPTYKNVMSFEMQSSILSVDLHRCVLLGGVGSA